jgi:hypothetical protein
MVEVSPERRPKEQLPEPGTYDGHLTAFGSGVKGNIDMGKKYITKYNDNPPPGLYDTEAADRQTKTKIRSAQITEDVAPFRRPKERQPEPGTYDGHLTAFGSGVIGNIDMGKKYITKYNDNPPPGLYDVEAADKQTKTKIRSA